MNSLEKMSILASEGLIFSEIELIEKLQEKETNFGEQMTLLPWGQN